MNRRQAITAAIAAGVAMIGIPSEAQAQKLRKIYRLKFHTMGYEWESVRMSQLKVGDKFVFQDEPNVISFDQKVYLVDGKPFKNEQGVWSVHCSLFSLSKREGNILI